MIKDILVCLEGSPGTVRAIELALELAREHGARLVGLAISDNGDRHEGVDEHRARLEARGQAVGVSTRTLQVHGQPAATILEEMTAHDLTILARSASFLVEGRPEKFIVFCDHLTFDAGEAGYKALKVMLDGSIAGASSNVLIYATSNRRHLLPEYFAENLETRHVGEEVHPGESVEEKISLSERFGLWVSFYPFVQDDYLAAVDRWLAHFGVAEPSTAGDAEARMREALQFALQRGSRSGRVAWQFARHWAGGLGLQASST